MPAATLVSTCGCAVAGGASSAERAARRLEADLLPGSSTPAAAGSAPAAASRAVPLAAAGGLAGRARQRPKTVWAQLFERFPGDPLPQDHPGYGTLLAHICHFFQQTWRSTPTLVIVMRTGGKHQKVVHQSGQLLLMNQRTLVAWCMLASQPIAVRS
jgi:hypothetical protein